MVPAREVGPSPLKKLGPRVRLPPETEAFAGVMLLKEACEVSSEEACSSQAWSEFHGGRFSG